MADKSSGEVVAEAAKKARDEYRASQPNLRTETQAEADQKDAEKGGPDNARQDLPTGARSHPR